MSEATGVVRPPIDGSALVQLGIIGLISFIVLALLLAGLARLTDSETTGAVDVANKTITLALTQEPPQLDSTRSTDQTSGRVLGHVIEGLLRYDELNRLAPGVAERWEVREDGATFWLRRDSVWNNGTPVTAHDFVFAWRKVVDPKNASEYAFILYAVKNAEAINTGEARLSALGVEAIDDYTLEVSFERPVPYFEKLTAFSTYFPVNEAFYESRNGRYGADAEDLLYNGPFEITRWVHGAQVRLEKNERYWDADRIALEVIDHAYITPDSNSILNLFKDRKVAYAELTSENVEDALQQRWKIQRFADGSVYFIEFNFRPGRVTANYNLRRALQLVNDPSELVYKVVKLPGSLPGESLFPVWLKGVNGYFRQEYPAPEQTVNVELARRHLALALEELGLEEIPPLVLLAGDTNTANKQSEYYQNLFKQKLGLEVKIDRQIFKQRLAKMTAGEFDMVMAGWGPDYDDPMTFGDLFASWNENNRGRYEGPVLDEAVRIAQNSVDPKTRMDAMAVVQRVLHDDAVILLNYERGTVFVSDPRIQGLVRRAVGADPDFTNVTFVDSAL